MPSLRVKKNYGPGETSSTPQRRNEAPLDGDASDGQLMELVRNGGTLAYEELYRRHVSAATKVARKHVDSYSDADDVISEAFASVLESLVAGKGPDSFFRAYLLCAVSRISHQKNRAWAKTKPTDDLTILDGAFFDLDTALQSFEEKTIVAAFKALPERWQAALWYVDIEGMKPAAAAPFLGLSPNGVSSLVGRAREGLSRNYLQNHIAHTEDSVCAEHLGQLGAFVRNGLNGSTTKKIDAHLEKCKECSAVLADLADVQSSLRAGIFPLVAGLVFWEPTATLHGAAAIGAGRWPDFKQYFKQGGSPLLTVAAGATAAIVLVAAATAVATQGFGAWAISTSTDNHLAAPDSRPTSAASPSRRDDAAGTIPSPSALRSPSPIAKPPSSAPSSLPPAIAPSSPLAPAPSSLPSAHPATSPSPESTFTSSPSFPTASPVPSTPARGGPSKETSLVVGVGSGRCLTTTDPAGTQLAIADCITGDEPQNWSYDTATQTMFAVVAGTTYCLDAEGSGAGNGVRIVGWSCTGQPNQRWTVDQAKRTIVGIPSGRCLSVQGAETNNGAPVELWDCSDTNTNQQWIISTPSS